MAAPTASSVTLTSIVVDWAELVTDAEIGGSAIVSYNLRYDEGSNGAGWADLIG
jgi:hypothetical protein